jgi:hypothetical protein
MGLHDIFRRNDAGANIPNRDEIISRYKRLRAVGRNLNHKMVERLSKDVLHEGGKKLGILHKGVLVFNSEDESAILMDYCLYDVRRNGRNAVDQYLLDSEPAPESDEMVCLRSMQHAVYSLFIVESVIPGFGVTVRDLLSKKTILVADLGLGRTGKPGLVLASRLLFQEGFAMTGGAILPVGVLTEAQQESIAKTIAGKVAPDDCGRFDPAPVIRLCLEQDCSSSVRYQDLTGGPRPRRRLGFGSSTVSMPADRPQASKPIYSFKGSRNAPCSCGSGKKFKNCCMRRQIGGP